MLLSTLPRQMRRRPVIAVNRCVSSARPAHEGCLLVRGSLASLVSHQVVGFKHWGFQSGLHCSAAGYTNICGGMHACCTLLTLFEQLATNCPRPLSKTFSATPSAATERYLQSLPNEAPKMTVNVFATIAFFYLPVPSHSRRNDAW